MRIRKQNEVEAKNNFYFKLLHEALPPENVSQIHSFGQCVSRLVQLWYYIKYINPRVDPYSELPGDDQSSENTESDTVAEESEKEPTLFQKLKPASFDLISCLCYTLPLKDPWKLWKNKIELL